MTKLGAKRGQPSFGMADIDDDFSLRLPVAVTHEGCAIRGLESM
jgi:hypothetical protein